MKFLRRLQAPAILLLGVGSPAMAQQPSEIDELAGTYGDTVEVSIATGTKQKIRKAPSSASVITAKDIEAMGATDLMEVLESVVGLHVSTATLAQMPRIYIRGIGSEFNPEVLILINGDKINTQFHGNPSLVFGGFPLANVARIEIIRGPGSALYGADAFSGVINIITKSAEEIDGLEVTWSANRNLTFTGNYSYQRSKDETSGKDAGLAPQHRLFVRSNWRFAPNWQFGTTANYVSDRDRQPGDPRTFTVPDYTTVDISLRREKLWKNWEFQVAVKNLLDRDVFEPTLSPGNIRFDLPLAGRSFYAQMIYKFQQQFVGFRSKA